MAAGRGGVSGKGGKQPKSMDNMSALVHGGKPGQKQTIGGSDALGGGGSLPTVGPGEGDMSSHSPGIGSHMGKCDPVFGGHSCYGTAQHSFGPQSFDKESV
jgi:hypothetical protein